MSELKWPCRICYNNKTCGYEKSWKQGGGNWFCPGMNAFLNQDHKRRTESRTVKRTDEVKRSYMDSLNEQEAAINKEHSAMHDEIMKLPCDTLIELKTKAVAALAFFGIHKSQIQDLLSIPQATFYRIYRGR